MNENENETEILKIQNRSKLFKTLGFDQRNCLEEENIQENVKQNF